MHDLGCHPLLLCVCLQDATHRHYTGTLDCAIKTVRHEGVAALWKGFWPTWARLGPWQLVFWTTYEQLRTAAGMGGF
jgi:solute carrier family 25 uncoupling protein 27